MYGYYENDWNKRVFATDCYLLGSMVVFYITGISMSALLMKNIPDNFRAEKWRGNLDQVKPYITDSFVKSLQDFEKCIHDDFFKEELKLIVEYLCYPFPADRGHPKDIASIGSNYNLERFVSRFDYLFRKAEYNIKKIKIG